MELFKVNEYVLFENQLWLVSEAVNDRTKEIDSQRLCLSRGALNLLRIDITEDTDIYLWRDVPDEYRWLYPGQYLSSGAQNLVSDYGHSQIDSFLFELGGKWCIWLTGVLFPVQVDCLFSEVDRDYVIPAFNETSPDAYKIWSILNSDKRVQHKTLGHLNLKGEPFAFSFESKDPTKVFDSMWLIRTETGHIVKCLDLVFEE